MSLRSTLTTKACNDVKINISCKNLIPYPYGEDTKTADGITYTVQTDGGIKISGTSTAISHFYIVNSITLVKGQTYTLSSNSGQPLTIADKTNTQSVTSINTPQTFVAQYTEYYIYITVSVNITVNDIIVYPQLEIGSTATNYEKYNGGVKPVKKVVYGSRNLFAPSSAGTQTITGVTFTNNSNGTITVNGTATANSTFNLGTYSIPKDKTLTLSGCPSGGGSTKYYLYAYDTTNSKTYTDVGNGKSFEHSSDSVNLYIRVQSGITASNLIFKPQLEFGNKKTDYVNYSRETVWTKSGT